MFLRRACQEMADYYSSRPIIYGEEGLKYSELERKPFERIKRLPIIFLEYHLIFPLDKAVDRFLGKLSKDITSAIERAFTYWQDSRNKHI